MKYSGERRKEEDIVEKGGRYKRKRIKK